MSNYFMHPLFEYIDFSCLDEAMELFGFDYVKIAYDEIEYETYEELSESSFDPAFADVWLEILTERDETGWLWAGYWVTEDGNEYFMLVKPKDETASKAYAVMAELFPFRDGSVEQN